MSDKPHINQISHLMNGIQHHRWIKDNFIVDDSDDIWNHIKDIDNSIRRRLWSFMLNEVWDKLEVELLNLGFQKRKSLHLRSGDDNTL